MGSKRKKTTVFDFYQYFYNVDDCDTEMLLRLFTRVPLEEIISICDQDIRKAKTLMAYEITKLVHGEDEATKALQTAKELFGKKSSSKHMPMCQQDKALIANNISLIDLLCITGFVPLSQRQGVLLHKVEYLSIKRRFCKLAMYSPLKTSMMITSS